MTKIDMALHCVLQHQVATKYNMSAHGLNMYPSWYARYLLAFNNQLKCRERVQDLRHRLISEEQRYLDQASNRVRDFVLAGKHTVRPLVGNNLPSSQPIRSHPLTTKSLPTRLPSLKPQQGQAIPDDGRGNCYDVTHPRRRRRRKRKTPSPQYPTFCFEELVVRAEAEKRREARRKKNTSRIPPSTVAMATDSNQDNQTGCSGDVPLALVDYQQSSNTLELSDDMAGVRLRGTQINRTSRDEPRGYHETSAPISIKLPPLEPTQVTMVTSLPLVTINTTPVKHSRSDSHTFSSTNSDPAASTTTKARNAHVYPTPSPDQAVPSDRYIPPTTSPASVTEELKTGDVVTSGQTGIPNLDTGFVVECNSRLPPKEPSLLEDSDASIAPTPAETTSLPAIPSDDRKRLKRKEYQRKHMRQLKRNSLSISNENKANNSLNQHSHPSPTQDGDFSEIEAVRRWQLIGEESEQKMDDVI